MSDVSQKPRVTLRIRGHDSAPFFLSILFASYAELEEWLVVISTRFTFDAIAECLTPDIFRSIFQHIVLSSSDLQTLTFMTVEDF